jgi:hypothetical protein
MATDSDYLDQPEDKPIDPVKNAIIATVLAVILVIGAGVAYVHFGRNPPEATGNVIRVNAAAMPLVRQTEEGSDIPLNIADQYLAFVQVHITNVSDKELVIQDIQADLQENGTTVADPKNPDVTTTTIKRSVAASVRDYNKLFETFPQFSAYKTSPIPDDAKIEPHQSLDGTLIFSFGVNQKEWDLRKGLLLHVNFDNNTSLPMQAP